MAISKIPGKGTQNLFNHISDAGTEGTKVAAGTTAQRGSTTGQWRYNTTTGFFEGRNAGGRGEQFQLSANHIPICPEVSPRSSQFHTIQTWLARRLPS